MTYDHIMATK